MTATVTVRARAVPVTVTIGETTKTVEPWNGKDFHVDGNATVTVTEAEPAPVEEPDVNDTSSDEAVAAGLAARDAEEATDRPARGRRAPAADSSDTTTS